MANLTFKYTESLEESREVKGIELLVPDDMDIAEFKQVCARLALSIGYQPSTVTKAFGDYEDVDDFVHKLIKNA
jgi:hypothetical protein